MNAAQARSPQDQNTQGVGSSLRFRSQPATHQPGAGCQDLSQPGGPCQGSGVMAAPGAPPRIAGQPVSSEQSLAGAEHPACATSVRALPPAPRPGPVGATAARRRDSPRPQASVRGSPVPSPPSPRPGESPTRICIKSLVGGETSNGRKYRVQIKRLFNIKPMKETNGK